MFPKVISFEITEDDLDWMKSRMSDSLKEMAETSDIQRKKELFINFSTYQKLYEANVGRVKK